MKLSGSSHRALLKSTKSSSSSIKMYKGELGKLAPLTAAQLRELENAKRHPIDFTDIPPLTPELMRKAIRSNPNTPRKQQR